MNVFELDKISTAAVNLSTAETLLYSFFEEYLEDVKCETLKFDAEHRPDIITAKISAVLSIMREALLDIEAVDDPEHSQKVAAYLNEAERLHAYIKEKGGSEA